jgi:hypothetical protein
LRSAKLETFALFILDPFALSLSKGSEVKTFGSEKPRIGSELYAATAVLANASPQAAKVACSAGSQLRIRLTQECS